MKVTVVIPCYNYGQYLSEAINSVLSQTFQDFDIMVVDDGSDDNSGFLIESICSKESRVKVISHAENKGVSAARNNGIRSASGECILTLDADDILHRNFLEYTLPILLSGRADIVYTDIVILRDEKQSVRKMPTYDFSTLIRQNQFCSCILFWKNHWEEIGGYNESFTLGYEDWEFGLNMGKHGHFGYRVPKPLFYYRQHGNSRNTLARKNEWLIRNKLHEMYSDWIK